MSEVLRTPPERFADLPGFSFAGRLIEDLAGFEGLGMYVIDEGPAQAPVFLCLHGEPTWSFLYRKMLPVFLRSGGRVIAPDFFGFGRSDKPTQESVYTFDFHRRSLVALVQRCDLHHITLVCQDWGGILGLTLPMQMPERFDRLIVMNTMLGVGDLEPTAGFRAWRKFVADHPDFPIGALMRRACPELSAAELAAYEAPFPDVSYRAGVRRFPEIVPVAPDDPGAELSRQARAWWSEQWRGQTFMAVGLQDPVLGLPAMTYLRGIIRDCPPPMLLGHAGHFVQEHGEQVARAALEAFAR